MKMLITVSDFDRLRYSAHDAEYRIPLTEIYRRAYAQGKLEVNTLDPPLDNVRQVYLDGNIVAVFEIAVLTSDTPTVK